ncbi:MAG: PEP/pyruvate-binding domain-containing protein [Anaerolineaceae bacterium]|jgi:pyruvate,water dikinase
MSTFILPLSDLEATLEAVGGKGMSLAKLSQAGLPVPGGFHVTTDAYRCFVADNGLQSSILAALQGAGAAQPASLDAVSQEISKLFAAASIPAEIATAISAAYADMKDAPVAVRSSATAEDLPNASFAGQQDTYLNIHGEAAVLDAIKRCWASLWTARAIGYRLKNGIDQKSVALAVVVQELVPADAAGVMFTANPLNGRRDQAVINAAWGLGEAIVSGTVTPDTITIDKHTEHIVHQQIAEKMVMTVRTPDGTQERPVPGNLKKKPVLSQAQTAELANLGAQVEDLYGRPMDIEWALSDGKFALVQARPITSLPEPPLDWTSPNPKAFLARMSFAEFVPDPISPLFATLALPIARDASLEMMGEYLKTNDPNAYLFTVVNDYVYIGMVLDLKMILAMLSQLRNGVLQQMLTTSQARWTAMSEKYRAVVEKWQKQELAACSSTELLEAAKEIFGNTAEYYTVAQSGPIPGASGSELSFSRFYKTLVKRKSDPDASIFMLGFDNLPLRAEKSLFDLAQWLKTQPELAKELMQTPAKEIGIRLLAQSPQDNLTPAWKEFSSRFNSHLAAFGHTLYDLDFAKPVPADDPAPLLETIKTYLDGKGSDPYARQRAAVEQREQAAQAISKRLDPLRRKWFQKLLAWAQDCAPKREDCISELGWGYPILHKVFTELGSRLSRGGAIIDSEDIYWLEAQELEALVAALEHGETLSGYSTPVEQRKAMWQRAHNATPPMVLPEKSFIGKLMVHESKAGDTLKGVGASSGKVTAPACVLRDPKDFGQMHPGDVIVAVTTTPAWTPLFAMASGVVAEIGGPLSHSSIVAREYGIPAVLGVIAATRRIHSGQLITVDGAAGKVFLGQSK